MNDIIWSEAVENLVAEAYTLVALVDDPSDEEIAKYVRQGWEQRGELWTRTIRRSE